LGYVFLQTRRGRFAGYRRKKKDQKESREWLVYNFSEQTDRSVNVDLRWERWSIPFTISVDLESTTVDSLQRQLSGELYVIPWMRN